MKENIKEIPVLILCGGLGTRMREETEYKPKPMAEIGGKPILWHIMKIYSNYGFHNFILALGYKGDMIKNYFLNYKYYNSDFELNLGKNQAEFFNKKVIEEEHWNIKFINTGDASQTGARIKKCEKYIQTDDFCVTYGDGVCNVNLIDEYRFHTEHKKLVTMLGVRPMSKFGELVVDDDKVINFSEKPQISKGLINGGFFFMKKEFFKYLNSEEACTLEGVPLEAATADNQVMLYKHEGFWQCMDTYRDYLHFNSLWTRNERPWAVWQ